MEDICLIRKRWDNGNLKYEEFLNPDNTTTLRNYNSEGKLMDEIRYDSDNFKHGVCKKYFPNGFLKLEEVYTNGQLQIQKVYNHYGQILSSDYYQDGELIKRIITMLGIIEF